ncbi:hypothetical protein BU23DRAFT_600255 [Bimuria novae-zelandiae CBS 107.79]|uniref:Uncharacterized protein n=1 Tax=Bimuria novae-zelandiae CBS 107.79 TaxID=1447943 RepID=A0A6A5V1R4_9PLEO|nr:hypothetical protein BU23DRAFT_600255 [Bimuria novae-zelandiae CBS 107.79]
MTRYTEIAARLENLRPIDSDCDTSMSEPTRSSPTATEFANATVKNKQEEMTDMYGPGDSAIYSDTETEIDEAIPEPMSIPKITQPQPQPTLTLPVKYPFLTTENGYPVFRKPLSKHYNQMHRASMTNERGFMDPRITAFVDYWTKFYIEIGNDPLGPAEGAFQLRLACKVRGLVTYGTMDRLVTRLVERALRDAARGWSEIADTVGRTKYQDAPGLPEAVGAFDKDYDSFWE